MTEIPWFGQIAVYVKWDANIHNEPTIIDLLASHDP